MLFMQSQECEELFYFQHFLCSWRNISSPPIDTLGHHHHYCSHLFMLRNKLLLFSGWTRESRTLNPFNSVWYTRKTALSHSVSNVHGLDTKTNSHTHTHTQCNRRLVSAISAKLLSSVPSAFNHRIHFAEFNIHTWKWPWPWQWQSASST